MDSFIYHRYLCFNNLCINIKEDIDVDCYDISNIFLGIYFFYSGSLLKAILIASITSELYASGVMKELNYGNHSNCTYPLYILFLLLSNRNILFNILNCGSCSLYDLYLLELRQLFLVQFLVNV